MNKQAYFKMMKLAADQYGFSVPNGLEDIRNKHKAAQGANSPEAIAKDMKAKQEAQAKEIRDTAIRPYQQADFYSRAKEALKEGKQLPMIQGASDALKKRIEQLKNIAKPNITERGQNIFDWANKGTLGGIGLGGLGGLLFGWNMLGKKRSPFLRLLSAIAFGGLGAGALGLAGRYIGGKLGGSGRPLTSAVTNNANIQKAFDSSSGITNWFAKSKA